MSSPSHERSPLARLVLFIICLSIAGSFIAGIHYLAIDLPAQKNVQAPENGRGMAPCLESCYDTYCTRVEQTSAKPHWENCDTTLFWACADSCTQ
ncbi:MAG: hypothetical protein ACYDDV_07035 [Methanoregula sp.]